MSSQPERPGFRRGLVGLKPIDPSAADALPEGPSTDITKWLVNVRLEPRREEAALLSRIEQTADDVVAELFADADRILESLRLEARKVVMRDVTADLQMPKANQDTGEIEYVRDVEGRFTLDWSRVDGMDVEKAIMGLQEVIDRASDQVAILKVRATWAWQVKEDEYWDAYRKSIGSTINDSVSAAMRATKDSRFHYFVVWSIWERAERRLAGVQQAKRDLEFMRQRLVREADQPQPPRR